MKHEMSYVSMDLSLVAMGLSTGFLAIAFFAFSVFLRLHCRRGTLDIRIVDHDVSKHLTFFPFLEKT